MGPEDEDVLGRKDGGVNGKGSQGFGMSEHNFKSQTLQFQTNLGSDFINLFAPSEQGADRESSDNSEFTSEDEKN